MLISKMSKSSNNHEQEKTIKMEGEKDDGEKRD